MGITINVKEFKQLLNSSPKKIRKLVKVGARELKKELEKNTPIDSGKLAKSWELGSYTIEGKIHYIDIFNTAQRFRMKDGFIHYGSFPNNGFYHVYAKKYIAGQHFVEKSEFIIKNKLNEIIGSVLENGL